MSQRLRATNLVIRDRVGKTGQGAQPDHSQMAAAGANTPAELETQKILVASTTTRRRLFYPWDARKLRN